ncbi:MAG: hypothetical protein KF874_13690 [Rhizobiaceae bacterium]|nr:hypothetical protein [Rhizobiaceae bacterium]
MEFFDLLGTQLTDPFRIALLIGLLVTANNTAAHTGHLIPVALGVLFIAVLIPSAFGAGPAGFAATVAAGIAANLIILAICWVALTLYRRATAPR